MLLSMFSAIKTSHAYDCVVDTDGDGIGDGTSGASSSNNIERVACGNNANASGENSTAIGANTSVISDDSVAIGNSASATGFGGSTAVGKDAVAANRSTAIGLSAIANSFFGGVAIGRNAESLSNNGLAVGQLANVDENSVSSIALGFGSKVTNADQGIAIGGDLDANNIGAQSLADGAIAIGADATADALNTVALGNNATATAGAPVLGNSVAIGSSAFASTSSVSIGAGTNTSSFFGGTTVGRNGINLSSNGVALGQSVSIDANSQSAIAIGFASKVENSERGIAIGGDLDNDNVGAQALADGAIAIGADVVNDVPDSMKVAVPFRIENDQGTAAIKVVETNTTSANRQLLDLENNGGIGMRMNNTNAGAIWDFNNTNSGNFTASKVGTGGFEFQVQGNGRTTVRSFGTLIMDMRADGNLHIPEGDVIVAGTTLNVPDYVFEHDYELMPLDELKTFVKKNKHLPNVASEAEIKKSKQMSIAKSHLKHLEKIEELTLYTIEQHEQIKLLKSENQLVKQELNEKTSLLQKQLDDQTITLKAENSDLKERLASLEKLVTNLALGSDSLKNGDKVVLK